jgi:SAM-dependent methyltransferase
MSTVNSTAPPVTRTIEYLSPPAPVSMSDDYFQIAGTGHFWVRRRFEVLRKLAGDMLSRSAAIAEIGCGHGLLQRQIEDAYGKPVTGFDLNEYGLQHNISRISRVCCYDIRQKAAEFAGRFDLVLLFDVLEHIDDESGFLQAVEYHLAPGGVLIVSVPAGKWAFSNYDRVAGHVRRYSLESLKDAGDRAGFEAQVVSYWGLPLIPALLFRKIVVARQRDPREIYGTGFDSRSSLTNSLMGFVSECEFVPQHLAGTSVMAVLRRRKQV